jgi:hypothetical protein
MLKPLQNMIVFSELNFEFENMTKLPDNENKMKKPQKPRTKQKNIK